MLSFCSMTRILSFGEGLILSQTSPIFYVSTVEVVLKHSGKRRNCHSVFCRFGELSLNLKLSSVNSLSLEESKLCHLAKG